jgi:hypothetical protein
VLRLRRPRPGCSSRSRRQPGLARRERPRRLPHPGPALAGRAQPRRHHHHRLVPRPEGVCPDGRFPLPKTSRSPAAEPASAPTPARACGCTSPGRSKSSALASWWSRMSADCSPHQPPPLATWNPARGVWETPQISLLCGHLVPYSDAWPTSGTTHAGSCFAPATSEHPTAGNGSSSPPGPPATLLKTPTSNLATNGGSQHPAKRKNGGHGPTLADEVEWLLPTPKPSDGTKCSPNQRHDHGDLTLPSATASLRPSPNERNTTSPAPRPENGSRPTVTAVALPLWTDTASQNTESPAGDGDRTPRPSPDGSS